MGVYTDKGGGLYTGGGGIFVRKNTFICSLLNLLLFFLFFQYKARIFACFTSCKMWNLFKVNNKAPEHVTLTIKLMSCKMWNMFKVNNKAPEYVKLTIKLTIKTPLTLFWSLLLNLNIFHFLWQCFCCWLWSVNCCGCCGCCLLFWHFVPLETI